MFGVVISPLHFSRCLFCYSNVNYLYIEDKEETNLIARSSHSNFLTIPKDKTKRTESLLQLQQIFLVFIRSCCRRSEKATVLLKNST